MAAFGVAVVGTGFIGPIHVEALRRLGIEVIGILGSTPEKSQQAAEILGIERGFVNYGELLADRRVRAVHVAAPNHLHFDLTARALAVGKHVMCEKPLATNSRDSAELVRLAQKSHVAAGVTYNIRYYPLCREAAERVRLGEIGSMLHVSGSYVQDWLLLDTDYNWRVAKQENGVLRAIADIGTHWLDLVQYVVGQRVVAVCADLQTVHRMRLKPAGGLQSFAAAFETIQNAEPIEVNTEDAGFVLLKFSGGARGCLCVSQVTAGRKNALRFEAAGSRQAMAWDSERPNELWIGRREAANELLLRDPALMQPAARDLASYPGGHNEGFADTFKQLFREFYQYIITGDWSAAAPFPTFADGHYEVLLCEAISRSHLEQRWAEVKVEPIS